MWKTLRRPSAAARTWPGDVNSTIIAQRNERKNSHKIAALKDTAGIQVRLPATGAP